MKRLTAKQEQFCLEVVSGSTASDAYRKVYSDSGKPETIWRKSVEVMQSPAVTERIDQLRAEAAAAAKLTLEQHLEDLRLIRDGALQNGAWGPAVSAEVARGKAAGLYVEKTETKFTATFRPASIEEFV